MRGWRVRACRRRLQDAVRATLPADWTVAKLDGLIETQRTAWAALEAERTVQGHGTPRDAAG